MIRQLPADAPPEWRALDDSVRCISEALIPLVALAFEKGMNPRHLAQVSLSGPADRGSYPVLHFASDDPAVVYWFSPLGAFSRTRFG